jgi:hypothetical protein
MKMIRIIATILVSVSMAFILACSEEKAVSLEGHEDKVAVLQKLVDCLDTPETTKEIFAENAVLKWQGHLAQWREQKGVKEIQKYYKERGENYRYVKLAISDIKEDADNAHVEYQITMQDRRSSVEYKANGSAEMVKQGQAWKIKDAMSKMFQ